MDARAVAERFRREGPPLYERPALVHELLDEQATVVNVRRELKWLQETARPGQKDTVIIYLSGHGVSEGDRYYFATYDMDLKNIAGTSLAGRELREALGPHLSARAVFVFVDTCHSGGLSGRNEDLDADIGRGVYLLASSGSTEYSYEDPRWGHGAFTKALLWSLDNDFITNDGEIQFFELYSGVLKEITNLMKAANQTEDAQRPCLPLAGRDPTVRLARVRR
jgi:uncharacterized caspase-like protein